ncbi:PREDICTED: piggyBac transposable element-derived protein 4-like [Eufriesea mexicana]|uniref:piggyBac transposable element-derived protein 4-like n=1 Tax=Eufriesea mexicana TaxID=516756 RepID=UPI00083C70FA|nr:PREDICTED: piggyBac transposable element-derived protein 4-like [Eufriesea mexicana]
MSLERKFSDDDDSESSSSIAQSDFIDIFDSDSESSDILSPVRKRCKQLVIEDDIDDDVYIDDQQSEHWIWKEESNKPKVWNYTETPGIKVAILNKLGANEKELDIFDIIFDNTFWENIVTETNRYAEQIINNKNRRRKIDETWFPVDSGEIKIYFALCIIMAQVKKATIQMNWSKRAVIETPIFRKTMPLKRFLQITRCLHFANNNAIDNTDKLRKIKPVTNFFNQRFKEAYTMQEDITIDASLIKYKGRLPHKPYHPSKRARFGIKFYKLCESASGYCYDFKIYIGTDKRNSNESASENVVKELLQSVLHKGHTLYLNDWYSSPKLFMTLLNSKTNAVGTVRSNRENMPKDFIKGKLQRGECKMRSCNKILALKWCDKRNVYIISTKHETAEMTEEGKNQFDPILKPKSVIEYNKGMIGIDRQDQMLACFPVMRKCTKGYRKVFFYVFDIALFNCYILFNKLNTGKQQSYAEYRIEKAESLLKNIPLPEYKRRGQLLTEDLPQRLHAQHWGHFPMHIGPTPSKSNPSRVCKVCSRHKKRSETTWECKRCKVALHVPVCFERYHTVEDY